MPAPTKPVPANPFFPFAGLAAQQMNAANAMGLAAMEAGMAMMGQPAPQANGTATGEPREPEGRAKATQRSTTRTSKAKSAPQPKRGATANTATGHRTEAPKPARRAAKSWYQPIRKTPTEAWAGVFGMDDPKHPLAPAMAGAQMAEHAAQFWSSALPLMPQVAAAATTPATRAKPARRTATSTGARGTASKAPAGRATSARAETSAPAALANPFAPFLAAFAPTLGDTTFTWVDSWLDATQPRPKPTTRKPSTNGRAPSAPLGRETMAHCARDLPNGAAAPANGRTNGVAATSDAGTNPMMAWFDPFGLLSAPTAPHAAPAPEPEQPALPARTSQRRTQACAADTGNGTVRGYRVADVQAPRPATAMDGPIPLISAQYHPPSSGQGFGASPWGFISITMAVPPSLGEGLMSGRG